MKLAAGCMANLLQLNVEDSPPGRLVGFLLYHWNGKTCEMWSYHMGPTKARATYP